MNICEINDCTGCVACTQVCPVNCIEMIYNDEGFLYPNVSDKCILCGACRDVCPVNNPVKSNSIKDVYTGYSKDEKILLSSTSGGIFTELSHYVINRGGYIFGVEFTENFLSVKHTFTNNLDYIANYRGSKYIQSETNNAFEKAKRLLDKGVMVLFSGTPCQIAGLRNFLAKEYENLLTMDFICHGVASKSVWNDFLLITSKGNKINKVNFRSKINGYNNGKGWSIEITLDNGINYLNTYNNSPLGFAFAHSYINRTSCFTCPYAKLQRVSDITLSDYIGSDNREYENKNGCSAIFINTQKGLNILGDIEKNLVLVKRDINNDAFVKKLPTRIRTIPYVAVAERNKIFKFYKKNGYVKTAKKYFCDKSDFLSRIRNFAGKWKKYSYKLFT